MDYSDTLLTMAASLYLSTLVLGLGNAGVLFISVAASVLRGPEA